MENKSFNVYDINEVNSEINVIKSEVEKMIKSNIDLKDFYNNGIIIEDDCIYNNIGTDLKEKTTYKTYDSFLILNIDLNKFKDKNPREIINETGTHPIYKAEKKLKKLIKDYIEIEHPNFEVVLDIDSWDVSMIFIYLK